MVDSNGKRVISAVVFPRDEEGRLINSYSALVSVAAGRFVHASLSVFDELDRDVGEMRDMESVKAMLATGFEARLRTFGPLAPGTYRVIATLPEGGIVERRLRLDGQAQQTLELRPEG